MVVCLCNYLSENKIKHAIDQGAESPKDIYDHYGVEMDCGQCLCQMQSMCLKTQNLTKQ